MGLQDSNIGLSISRKVNGPVTTPNRFVVPTGTDRQVAVASAQNAAVYGVIPTTTRNDQDVTQIIISGVVIVEAGGTIADGDFVICDSVGRAITDPATAAITAQIAGKARGSATVGLPVGIDLHYSQVKR